MESIIGKRNMYKQRLELDWIGKNNELKLEPRILIPNKELSYGDLGGNLLIHGDNLLALKALEQDYSGQVKCVYIDPPYNTGNAFEYYEDNLEHSTWLNLMKPRIDFLYKLLRKDGFLCVQIDESEGAYLKVLLDEVFGRQNYLTTFYVQVRYPSKTLKEDMAFHKQIEQIHVYRKSPEAQSYRKKIIRTLDKFCYYVKEHAKGHTIKLGGKSVTIFKKDEYEIIEGEPGIDGLKEIWASGTILDGNSSGRFFRDYLAGRKDTDGLGILYKVSDIGDDGLGYRYFTGPIRATATKGKYFQGLPSDLRSNDSENISYAPIENFYDFAAEFGNCRHEGGVEFRSGKKPEKLIATLLEYFTKKGDLVLDSFAGSGTTAAVSHKMGRKWITIELKDHCRTHVKERLINVCSGKDNTGVSSTYNWNGGGGFTFCELAPSLLQKDSYGNWIISHEYNAIQLAEAVCKHEGFKFWPDENVYWKQGKSTEKDFIFVTTEFLTTDRIEGIVATMKPDESLLICAKAFRLQNKKYPNITIKKIPQILLGKCEFSRDDYSLNI